MIGYARHTEEKGKYLLTVDDLTVDTAKASVFLNPSNKTFEVTIEDRELGLLIAQMKPSAIPKDCERIVFKMNFPQIKMLYGVAIYQYEDEDVSEEPGFGISFWFDFDFENWKEIYSMTEYGKELEEFMGKREDCELYWNDIMNGFAIDFEVENLDTAILASIQQCIPSVLDIHQQVCDNLQSRSIQEKLALTFEFPDEVKVPCEQYLLYFVQFLKDLGVDSYAEIRQQAGQVLFTITPVNEIDALEKIRMALEIYLKLPVYNSMSIIPSTNLPVEIQRLVANIYHLRSELLLTQAIIQQKDMLIQQQQTLIQQQISSGHILLSSIKSDINEVVDKEPLVGSVVSVKKYEWEFLELDLPTLLRKLKQLFNKSNANDI